MIDERDYVQQANDLGKLFHGETQALDVLTDEFCTQPIDKRTAHLDRINVELRSDDKTRQQRLDLFSLRGRLLDVHEALRKAGR